MSSGSSGEVAERVVLDDAPALAEAAADRFCHWAQEAIDARGVANVALTGGSSAAALYIELRSPARRANVDWRRLHLWWGDERYVPLDHPDSSAGLAIRLLFEPGLDDEVDRAAVLPIPADRVHPIPVDEAIGRGLGAAWAAERYAQLLEAHVPLGGDGRPAFDLILLGMGSDGHILSAFPGSPALEPDAPLVMAVPAPAHIGPHVERVTLQPRVLEEAERVMVMVPGSAKAAIVRDVFQAAVPGRWPAQLALRANATWLLDRESARELS